MKKHLLVLPAVVSLALMSTMVSCGDAKGGSDGNAKTRQSATKNTDAGKLPNYRYVDIDTVLANYNLSKDYNESMLHMQNNLETALRQKESSLKGMAGKFQQKYQNNGYSSQEEFERDQKTLANAQNSAQQEASQLQTNYEKQVLQMQKNVKDSIMAYVKIYNKKAGYDAILMKDATLYIDPALDITDEIVKGLNERYNKIKKQ